MIGMLPRATAMMSRVLRAVIFDLDGTLVDHAGAEAAALQAGLRRLDLLDGAGTQAERLSQWQILARQHMDAYLAGEYSFAEQRRRRLAAFLPLLGAAAPNEGMNEAWWAAYSADYESNWTMYGDVRPCLDALRSLEVGPKLGVLTNGDGRQQRAKLERFGMVDAFDGVYVSAEIGVAKPHGESFITACRGLGVAPADTLFVGDWIEGDAIASIAAGLVGVWLDRGTVPSQYSGPRITTLAAIPGLFAAANHGRSGG